MNKNQSLGIWLVVGILVLALASMLFTGPTTSTKTLSYTEFMSKVKSAEIKEVVIENDTVTAVPVNDEIKQNIDGKETVTASLRYKVFVPSNDTTLYPTLEANNVDVEIKNFKSKKESAINPLIENFDKQVKEGKKSKEELKQIADNILFETKNGPPYVYA